MPTERLRPLLARDGIFNTRDLGGLSTPSGRIVVPGRVVRGDALQRARGSVDALRDHGIVRVLDLRDVLERDESGVFTGEGIEVEHHPVLDPTFAWQTTGGDQDTQLLEGRYREILGAFGPRLGGAITSIADVVTRPAVVDGDGPPVRGPAVAFHCAVGKDRTGLLAALLLATLGVDPQQIAKDYGRSRVATAVQVQWLWSFGMPGGEATDEDMASGVWSALPATMLETLGWIDSEYGGAEAYLLAHGVPDEVPEALRRCLLTEPS